MITEDYVSFETAKLLKDKGFDEKCQAMYDKDGHLVPFNFKLLTKADKRLFVADAPTLQMAMKWLREIHCLTIDIFHYRDWKVTIKTIPNDYLKADYDNDELKPSETYEQACEAAIKYCLENLIDMITEDYVSFETAKLLKDKGFDEPTTKSYYTEGFETPMKFSHDLLPRIRTDEFLCPTLQMAMKWLRETHNICISVDVKIGGGKYYVCISSTENGLSHGVLEDEVWDTFEEASEEAIKYCLENLV